MRIRVTEVEKDGSCDCDCLHNNIVVESLVVALTLVSGLAITGENLVVFNLITVPLHTRTAVNISSVNDTTDGRGVVIITENSQARNVLNKVFHYVSLAIAGLFFAEIILKLCSLQKKFIINPWQVFDSLVVITSLILELTFHFVSLGHRGLYSLTYIVLLRLWRLPMLCNIRAVAALEASEYDLELYRNGRIKAEDRCRMLETTLSHRNETVNKLEKMLHDLTGVKHTDLTNGDGQVKSNGHMPYKSHTTDESLAVKNELPLLLSSDRQTYALEVRGAHRQSRYAFLCDTETAFESSYSPKSISGLKTDRTELPTSQLYKQFEKNSQTVCEETENNGQNSTKTQPYVLSGSNNVDQSSTLAGETNNVSSSKTSSTLLKTSPPLARRSQVFLRSRKRRSSASEILDYIDLSSANMDSVFGNGSHNRTSVHNSDSEKNPSTNKDIHTIVCKDTDSNTNNNIDSNTNNNIDTGGTNTVNGEDKKTGQIKGRTRRFASCPEYVFTQRMNITNDESMLIGDGHASHEHFGYNNLAFDGDENKFFPVISEYDGSTTYRNQDGIPMTSL